MSKSKPFDPEDMVYDSDGDFNLEDTLENTIGNRAKSPLPHNPPPGQKWQAKQGMARLRLNGAEYSVLACLLDRASKGKGVPAIQVRSLSASGRSGLNVRSSERLPVCARGI